VELTGLFGGAFDPPHAGHIALARAAKERFGIPRLTILVSEHPGHKQTFLPAEQRLELARVAFPDDDVRLDPYPRTIDMLRAERYDDPIFIIGADQFGGFLSWEAPDEVLERARLAVATRPGYPQEQLDEVLEELDRPERVVFFDLEPNAAASTDIRARAAAGESLDGLVPPAVADRIRELGLYARPG
jgi:nicotinate-nucleotide adenylyltransferase